MAEIISKEPLTPVVLGGGEQWVDTDLALARGLNNLWTNGGLIYALPLK